MEEKRIIVTPKGRAEILSDGSIGLVGTVGGYTSLGTAETARQYARAILELCGEAVPGKGDDTYIAVVKAEYGYFLGGRITGALTGAKSTDGAIEDLQEDAPSEEYHIFRRVATVGPIPQPEREVTRYE